MCICDVCWESLSVSSPLTAFPAPPHGTTCASLLLRSHRPHPDQIWPRSEPPAHYNSGSAPVEASELARASHHELLVGPGPNGRQRREPAQNPSTPHSAVQRLSRETYTPEPPAGVTGAGAQPGCIWCTLRTLRVCVRCTVRTLAHISYPSIPENHRIALGFSQRLENLLCSKLLLPNVLLYFLMCR